MRHESQFVLFSTLAMTKLACAQEEVFRPPEGGTCPALIESCCGDSWICQPSRWHHKFETAVLGGFSFPFEQILPVCELNCALPHCILEVTRVPD
eukprot:1286029-Amphidinium_carterae.1